MIFCTLAFKISYLLLNIVVYSMITVSASHANEVRNASSEDLLHTFLDQLNKESRALKEFCNSTNLSVAVVTDSTSYSLKVSVELLDSKFKNCYEFFNITLEKQGKIIDYAKIKYKYEEQESASYEFKNVSCGIYGLAFRPWHNWWVPGEFIIRYNEPINMTSNECIGLSLKNELLTEKLERKIIIVGSAISSVVLLVIASGLVFLYFSSVKPKSVLKEVIFESGFNGQADIALDKYGVNKDRLPGENIEVYILHYYDKNEVNKLKVGLIKDFLLMSGYFHKVRTIEDELSEALFDVNEWSNKMLENKTRSGGRRKIILVASEEDNKEDDSELENVIFSEFLDKISNETEQCLKGYDHLFVVLVDSNSSFSEKLQKIVRRVRFSLTEGLIEDHIISLCLNLCLESHQSTTLAEKRFRELLTNHPVRHLGII